MNIPLLQSATGMSFFTHAFNGVTWFLSALFCVYLLSPLLLYALRKTAKSYFADFLYLGIDLFFILLLARLFGQVETYMQQFSSIPKVDNLVYGSPYRRVFYVLAGMNIAMICNRLKASETTISEKTATRLEIAISLIAFAYFISRNSLPASLVRYVIDFVLCTSVVMVFSFDKGCISAFFNRPLLQRLGNMAMYIFLIHYPIRIYFDGLLTMFFAHTPPVVCAEIIIILLSTFLLSHLIAKKR